MNKKDEWKYRESGDCWINQPAEDPCRGIKDMLIAMLMRAYWDSMGNLTGISLCAKSRSALIYEACAFLFDDVTTEYGTASEICLTATGSTKFIKVLREAHQKGEIISPFQTKNLTLENYDE